MTYYNVVKPWGGGQLHYTRPTTQPIEVDDETAAELVESGCLTPYRPGEQDAIEGDTGTVLEGVVRTVPEGEDLSGDFASPILGEASENDAEASNFDAESKPRRPRRRTED